MLTRRFKFCGPALLAALALAGCEQPPPPPAQPVASDFYQAYLSLSPGGVPDASARAKLAPLISAGLLQLLTEADAAEARYAAAQTEPQPPLAQGDLFSSLFEGATGVEVKACKEVAEAAACDVLLSYAPPGQPPAQWRDVLLLVWTEQGWRVDDIEYGGDWPFGNKGSLRTNLQDVLKASP
ncbi:MAG: hypothetical protein ACK4E7_08600 [Permianibacter sp.]